MELFYFLDIYLHKLWLQHETYRNIQIQIKIGDRLIFSLKQEDCEISPQNGSLFISTGRSMLLPMKVDVESTRQYPKEPMTIEILEESSQSSSEDTIPHIIAHIPWEVKVPYGTIIRRDVANQEDASNCIRKTYDLHSKKTCLKVGTIDLGLRLTCMGTNVWSQFQKMSRFRKKLGRISSSESDRSPIVSEPQTEEEQGYSQAEDETSILIGTPETSHSQSIRWMVGALADPENEVPRKRNLFKKTGDGLENLNKKGLRERLSNILLGRVKHVALPPSERDFTINVCNTKSCPNPPREHYDAGIHSCSEIFGAGSARSKFCRKSRRDPMGPYILPCTRKTCLARSPCRPNTVCGPCRPDRAVPGVCCPLPGRVCPDCGGFSSSGRTCEDLKIFNKKHVRADRLRKQRERKQRTIYDCLKTCHSSTNHSKKVIYPGTCYPHGVPDDGGGACILEDGPDVQPKIIRGPIRVPFGAGREDTIRRPRVHIPTPTDGKYVYAAGERTPLGSHARHQFCNDQDLGKKIPANMGWLWTHRPLPGMKKVPDDWRPGFISEEIKNLLEERRKKQSEQYESGSDTSKSDTDPTDVYMVLVQPLNSSKLIIDGILSHVHFDNQEFQKIVELASAESLAKEHEKEQRCLERIRSGIKGVSRAICNKAIEDLLNIDLNNEQEEEEVNDDDDPTG